MRVPGGALPNDPGARGLCPVTLRRPALAAIPHRSAARLDRCRKSSSRCCRTRPPSRSIRRRTSYEVLWDGVRTFAFFEGGKSACRTAWAATSRSASRARRDLDRLREPGMVIDGEIVCLDADGKPDFLDCATAWASTTKRRRPGLRHVPRDPASVRSRLPRAAADDRAGRCGVARRCCAGSCGPTHRSRCPTTFRATASRSSRPRATTSSRASWRRKRTAATCRESAAAPG